jgi:hypothetical protein
MPFPWRQRFDEDQHPIWRLGLHGLWGQRGGDVLSHHIAAHTLEFVEAAKALGAWVDYGKLQIQQKPTPLPPRAALEVLEFESLIVAVAAGNIAKGIKLSAADQARVMTCAGRIGRLAEAYQ